MSLFGSLKSLKRSQRRLSVGKIWAVDWAGLENWGTCSGMEIFKVMSIVWGCGSHLEGSVGYSGHDISRSERLGVLRSSTFAQGL